MAKVILFANGQPGEEVARILATSGDEVCRLFAEGDEGYRNKLACLLNVAPEQVHAWQDIKSSELLETMLGEPADYLITVYWPYLLRGREIGIARDSVNFHPALLPINRGWFPHVHSILDGSPTGVTLHRITQGADDGPVWAQRHVELRETDTASDIYLRLQENILELFREYWPAIRGGRVLPQPQDESRAIYHRKSEIEKLDLIELDAPTTARQLIRQLRARTFKGRGFAYFVTDQGEKINIAITLAKG